MTQKTCMDCQYHVRVKDATGLVWNICSHPDHRGGMLSFPRCDDFVDEEDEVEIFREVSE